MNKYGVKYHPAVKSEDLPRLCSDIKSGIRKTIEEKLLATPHEYGLPLRKTLKGYWKLRVGDYRDTLFELEGDWLFCCRELSHFTLRAVCLRAGIPAACKALNRYIRSFYV